ncbi:MULTISPECIES: PAS domain-containing sensor histidine kinase [Bartonella]|uniref:histidine kinase n=1 Tax=Bartonella rochalimae ATCC BAA-1498 TaxID=685782 RepID=E6YLD2_9HYPH|nr:MULTISPECIES: PAS domain-containing sensor histidine kinase [Bartonella]AQX18495.1 PAS/PAC sensor signal transduction histidine kinase [Bartonella sp. A1379B]AQX23008.1 two-component system, NtrC family, nitrogen regulation sensor histidine kinase NtrY [Bartonella sp. 11B]AQX23695.1 two-component system, NtrC family, nitrogen regulation sensor histidine kinase NtrY [Bartonella sp. 114]AQX25461.1 PAS/PAC sensor signal transduction histidine kinase [Bartonella sp. Coyote22sub2]KEC54376.1 PAS 
MNTTFVTNPKGIDQNISKDESRRLNSVYTFLGVTIIVLALLTASISFIILIGLTPIVPNRAVTLFFIAINSIWILGLIVIVLYEVIPIIHAWRLRRAGSRLHVRLISLFALVATLPAVAVALVSGPALNLGLDRWFDTTTRQIVGSSIDLANAYADEMLQNLKNLSYAMALALDDKRLLARNPAEYRMQLTRHAVGRNLRGVFLLSSDGTIFASSDLGDEEQLPIPPPYLIGQATSARPFSFQPGVHDYFGIILKFNNISNTFLYLVRDVDRSVLSALRLTEVNTDRYRDLNENRLPTQIAFGMLYLCLFLSLFLSAIWTGIAVADRLVCPIRLLISAADDVASGNMEVFVPVRARDGDIGQLSKTFNYMVSELKSRRNELIAVRDQIDERRRFSEAVLSGVTAGVAGIDVNGNITIINRSIETMFGIRSEQVIGCNLVSLSSEIGQVFKLACSLGRKNYREQVTLKVAGQERVCNVQMTMEENDGQEQSWVLTIDDITDLVEAQRSSAWADIARRIAHEIKNPLTPIQLSAERIRRRYNKIITQDREVFDQCIDTIIRQVGDIGRMVDEFSSFARMPKPQMRILDIRELLHEACFLIEVTRHDIHFEKDLGNVPLIGAFDNRLIVQAFGNVIKNASEAIDAVAREKSVCGHILIRSYRQEECLVVEIIDNGKGFPKEQRHKLLEPYITTREKGTGLGLAIVRKVIEDHGGYMELHDALENFYEGRGAMIRMVFPVDKTEYKSVTQSTNHEIGE